MALHTTKLTLIACFIVTFVSSCGRGGAAEQPKEPVTLSLISLIDDSNGEKAALDEYMATYSHVTIERTGYDQFPQQYLLSESPPDVMGMGPSHILLTAIEQGIVMDITDIWNQSGLSDSYPASFKAMSEHNGKQYFVPVGYSWIAIYYNQNIFSQLGLMPPQTWDELIFVADSLLVNGVTPFSIAGQDPVAATLWFDYLNLRLNGPEFHESLSRGQESYDDNRVRQVFELWQTLFNNRYFVENASTMGSLESLTATIRGDDGRLGRHKAAMVLTTPFDIAELPDAFRPELDFFPFPIIDPTVSRGEILPSIGYMIPLNAPQPLESIDLLTYFSTADAQTMLFQPRNSLATFVPVNSELDQDSYSEELLKGMAIVREADHVMQQYFWNSPTSIQTVIGSTMGSFLRNAGDANVDINSLLLKLEDARQKAIAEQSFSN